MPFQYKIGEISALLGISPETLRFYEKRGLLHPDKSAQNGYRSYSLRDLYRLLDIIFYRRLDLGLEEIRHLLTIDDFTAITTLLAEKQIALEQKIAQETLTLKKLVAVRQSWQQIPDLLGKCRLSSFSPAYVLSDQQPDNNTLLQSFSITSQKHLELSKSLKPLTLCDGSWQSTERWIVVLDCALADELGLAASMANLPKLSFERCWQTAVRLQSGVEPLVEAAGQFYNQLLNQGVQPGSLLYSDYLCSSNEAGVLTDYYFLYAPI